MYVCMYVCMHACMYACMYVHLHIHTHTHTHPSTYFYHKVRTEDAQAVGDVETLTLSVDRAEQIRAFSPEFVAGLVNFCRLRASLWGIRHVCACVSEREHVWVCGVWCVCVCMCVCARVCICMHVCVYTCIHVYLCTCIYMYIYIYIYV